MIMLVLFSTLIGLLADEILAKEQGILVRRLVVGAMERVTFLWMLGERNAREGHREVYGQILRDLMENLRALWTSWI
jgi:hypothetical protein